MDIHGFLKSVQEAEDLNKYNVQLEKVLIKHPHEIFNLFKLIPKDRNYLMSNWQDRWLYDKIIDLSCTKQGAAYIRLAHSIFHEIQHEEFQLRIASILTASQDDNILVSELVEDQAKDLLVLVIHELVSRGVDFSQKEAFPKLTEINSQSEFSRLVLYPLSEETYNTFQSYSKHGSSHGLSFGNLKSAYEEVSINETIDIQYEENEQIKMNDFHWVNKSNGKMVNYMGTSSQLVPLEQIIPQFLYLKLVRELGIKN